MRSAVGIDDIAVYIPRLYVELADENRPEKPTEFSTARKSDPSKYLHGIGIAKMSIPDTYQDSAVLAANAIFDLMERNNVQPASLARIDIATETVVTNSNLSPPKFTECWNKSMGKGL